MTYLDPSGSQLGHKESIADTPAVLGIATALRRFTERDIEPAALRLTLSASGRG